MGEYIICVKCRKKSCSSYNFEFTWNRLDSCGYSYRAKLCDKCSHEFEEVLENFIGIKQEEADG